MLRPGADPLRQLVILAGLVALLVLAAPARGHRVVEPQRPLVELPLGQRERVQVTNLAHYRGAVRVLQRERQLVGLDRAGRVSLRWHRLALGRATRGLAVTRVLLGKVSWLQTIGYVGRFYPGTSGWLKSCSRTGSEGGWGRFVWNTQGSGAGGWLQFKPSTFRAYAPAAFADAARRGLLVPRAARSMFSRLGQAVVGAWMFTNPGRSDGGRTHWTGWAC